MTMTNREAPEPPPVSWDGNCKAKSAPNDSNNDIDAEVADVAPPAIPGRGISVLCISRIDRDDPIFVGEDPATVDIAMRRIDMADTNRDGKLNIHEVAGAVL